jgi:competence protein ComEC
MAVVHFLNVGHGDCSIIQHNSGRVTMIDVCKAWDPASDSLKTSIEKLKKAIVERFAANDSRVGGNFNQKDHPENPIEYLRGHGITSIFRFILSHPDMDHMDGLKALFEGFEVLNFWDTDNTAKKDFEGGSPFNSEDWDLYQALRSGRVTTPKRLTMLAGDVGQFWNHGGEGGTPDGLHILAPTAALVSAANECGDFNDCSYVVLYRTSQFRILFCGDSHDKTWEHLLAHHSTDLGDIDVLVAPHHGRDSDRDFEFLDVARPRLTLMGNARSEHLAYAAWNQRGLDFVTNNQAGTVILDIDESALNVYATNEEFAKKRNAFSFFNQRLKAWFMDRFEARAKAA